MTTQHTTSSLHLPHVGLFHPRPCLAMRPHWQLSTLLFSPQIQDQLPNSSSPCAVWWNTCGTSSPPAPAIRRLWGLGMSLEGDKIRVCRNIGDSWLVGWCCYSGIFQESWKHGLLGLGFRKGQLTVRVWVPQLPRDPAWHCHTSATSAHTTICLTYPVSLVPTK